MLKRMTPDGQLYYIQKSVEKINQGAKKTGRTTAPKAGDVEAAINDSLETAGQEAQKELANELEKAGEALTGQQRESGPAKKRARNHGVPVEDWNKEAGNILAEKLAKRLKKNTPKPRDTMNTVISDLLKFAESHVLPQQDRQNQQPRRPIDRLRDYFANKEAYSTAWSQAQKALRERYEGNEKALAAFEAFLGGEIDYENSPFARQKVLISALLDELKGSDGGLRTLFDRAALGAGGQEITRLQQSLAEQTGVTGVDRAILDEAIAGNVRDRIADNHKWTDLNRVIAKAIKGYGVKIAQIAQANGRQTALPELSLTSLAQMNRAKQESALNGLVMQMSKDYGISPAYAKTVADTITERYQELLKQSAEKQLEQRFKERGIRAKPEFWDEFRKLGNLGAFQSRFSQEAVKKLFGRDQVVLNQELVQKLLDAKNTTEMEAAADAILQNVADQVPAAWADKWNAWRYLAMLGNPKTHIRNLVSNAVFAPAVKLKKVIGAGLEKVLVKDGERTKAILTPKDKPLTDFAKTDFATVRKGLMQGGKTGLADAIQAKRKIFDLKPLEWLRKANLAALEAEDAIFLRVAYVDALASYMKANGHTQAYYQTKEGGQALNHARKYASQEALMATYRDANNVAAALNKFKATNKATRVLGEGLAPFTQTPLNIARRSLEYSPVGLAKGVFDYATQVERGNVTATQAVNEMAAGLTGTGIFALGAWLASMGLVSGGDDENDKENAYNQMLGEQNYSLTIGDQSYTIDWLAPVSLPLFVGVETYNTFKQGNGLKNASRFFDNLTKMSDPVFNLPMLQGLNSAIKATRYGDSPLPDLAGSAIASYVSQGVPTIVGQLARTMDEVRRNASFTERDSALPRMVDQAAHKIMAKIPGLSGSLPAYTDQWGREDREDNIAMRAFENFLSPGYHSTDKTTATDKALQALYQRTGDASVLPGYAPKSITVKGEAKYLTGEQYEQFSRQRGQLAYTSVTKLVKSKVFQAMADSDQIAALKMAYSYAQAKASQSIFSAYPLDGWMEKVDKLEKAGVSFSEQLLVKTLVNKAEGETDEFGNTISGSKKDAAIQLIAKAMRVTSGQATKLYNQVNSYAFSKEDLSSAQQRQLEQGVRDGTITEKQFIRMRNTVIGLTAKAAKKEALLAAGWSEAKAEAFLGLK
jgi:hypothetical protein